MYGVVCRLILYFRRSFYIPLLVKIQLNIPLKMPLNLKQRKGVTHCDSIHNFRFININFLILLMYKQMLYNGYNELRNN